MRLGMFCHPCTTPSPRDCNSHVTDAPTSACSHRRHQRRSVAGRDAGQPAGRRAGRPGLLADPAGGAGWTLAGDPAAAVAAGHHRPAGGSAGQPHRLAAGRHATVLR